MGLVEAASGYAWLALGLHKVCIGSMGAVWRWLRLPFFVLVLKFVYTKLFHIVIIWYIYRNKHKNIAKVIHVHLLHNKRERSGKTGISAVYTVLTAEQIGATKNYLLHAGLSGNGTLCTKRAIIKQSTLISCSHGTDD